MSTKYIHVRIHKVEMAAEGLRRTVHPKGGITYAYDLDGNTCRYAYAQCSARDSYNRAIGRRVAGGRLATSAHPNQHTFTIVEGEKVVDQILRYDNELARQEHEAHVKRS